MSSLICCRAQESSSNRRRLNNILIGYPQDFRHVSHYGNNDTQNDKLAVNMSSKCGEGVISMDVPLECIDLTKSTASNPIQFSDISIDSSNLHSVITEQSIVSKMSPPSYAPPPLPQN